MMLELITELEEGATDWRKNFGAFGLKKQGVGLTLACKNRLFHTENNMLKEIYDELRRN